MRETGHLASKYGSVGVDSADAHRSMPDLYEIAHLVLVSCACCKFAETQRGALTVSHLRPHQVSERSQSKEGIGCRGRLALGLGFGPGL